MNNIPYEYKNVPIPGGGYVTGFVFHDTTPGIMYIRTDIGGTYRFNYKTQTFESLIDGITMFDISETFPAALALDPAHPERLYVASGIEKNRFGTLGISEDYGRTFTYSKIPTMVHGNWNGRGTGQRLVVDPKNSDVLFYASQKGGLLKSTDRGATWTRLETGGEDFMSFVWVSPDSDTVIVSTAGVTTKSDDTMRGHSLYVSYDRGDSFEKLMQPKNTEITDSKMSGYVGGRYSYDGKYLYITMSNTGATSYVIENGYSCDSGDTLGGIVLRYEFDNGRVTGYTDITPDAGLFLADPNEDGLNTAVSGEPYRFGFGGVSACAAAPGLLVCTTICRKAGDFVFLSKDYGQTWKVALFNLDVGGRLKFNTSYMKPEYNGGVSLIHWMSDIKINPFNPDEAWFNSGVGVFRTTNLTADVPVFEDKCTGIEETVHINIYCPVSGPVQLVDIVGDLGGFVFNKLDEPCENTFADENNNRYITCMNADSPDMQQNIIYSTARGNWTGLSKGGLIKSTDYGQHFERIKMPFGLSDYIDNLLRRIETPNINSGWIAVSANGMNLVWCIADNINLPTQAVICSHDGGETWERTYVYDRADNPVTTGYMKVFADKIDSHIMYGFGSSSQIYVSKDAGRTFRELLVPETFPKVDFSLIDVADKTEIRAESGKRGVFYMALEINGLWKLEYNKYSSEVTFTRLSRPGDSVFRLGLGLLREGGSYINENKALYIAAILNGVYGFYRSFDEGKTWERINADNQMYGDINSIDADKRCFGRFFIATGSRGVLCGQEIVE